MRGGRYKMDLFERKRINVHEPDEMRFWSKRLNVPISKLRSAIERVGASTDMLFAFLKG